MADKPDAGDKGGKPNKNSVDREGNLIPGPIMMIGIKSGSQKNAKHYPEGYQPVEGAPAGSGLFTTPEACSSEFVCPVAGDCTGEEEPPGDDDPPVLS